LGALGLTPTASGEPSERAVGLIVLGQPAAQADVQLALDFSDRELLLACRLVAEIVALRRRSQAAERSGHELARLAAADALTGVANRRAWDSDAPERVRRAQSAGQSVCLALFDADDFKRVNDERGFSAGDAALAAIARELAARLRSDDLLARLGGDEFAALLCGSFDAPAAAAIVDRVRSAAGREASERLGFEVTLSAGCSVAASGQPADLTALLAAADAALRTAKRTGRDRTTPASGS
jgi:diguanylate cyclase (GGDEF)-like protein